jgi:hypothetical protein
MPSQTFVDIYRYGNAPRSVDAWTAAKQRNTDGNAKLGQRRFPGKADICKDYIELKHWEMKEKKKKKKKKKNNCDTVRHNMELRVTWKLIKFKSNVTSVMKCNCQCV